MGTLLKGTVQLEFDEDGFLTDPNQWNRQVAEQIASEDGLGTLGSDHWAVIFEMRKHYLQNGSLNATSHVCRANRLDPQCITTLFHTMREAWRVAGLPNPGEEAKNYM